MHNSSWRLYHSSVSTRISIQKVSKDIELNNSTIDQLDLIDPEHSSQQQKCLWHTHNRRLYPAGQ